MRRRLAGALVLFFCASAACGAEPAGRPKSYDDLIARLAGVHGVPEDFVHRIVKRESRYNPGLVRRQCFGLMQIKPQTARSMGYKGSPRGLLDPETNLTYGVPYLANAYRIADGNADRAVKLYSSGYYYTAKRKHMLGELRTAESAQVAQEPVPAPASAEPPNPLATFLSFLGEPPRASSADPGR